MIIPQNHKFNHPASKTYSYQPEGSKTNFIEVYTPTSSWSSVETSKKIQIWFLLVFLNRGVDNVCAFTSFHLHDSWLGLAWEKGAAIGSHPGTVWGHMKMAGWGGHVSNDLICQGESSFCEFRVYWFAYIFWWDVKLESFQQNSRHN